MKLWNGSKAELLTALAAAIGLPFYLGYVHLPLPQLVLYSGVAGTAIAVGEFAEQDRLQRGGMRLFLANAGVWVILIALFGGLTYLLALIF